MEEITSSIPFLIEDSNQQDQIQQNTINISLLHLNCFSFLCLFLYTYTYSFSSFFSIIIYYKILNTVPCPIHQVLVPYLFYIQHCVSVNPKFLIYLLPLLSPWVTTSLFPVSVNLFMFHKDILLQHILDSISE